MGSGCLEAYFALFLPSPLHAGPLLAQFIMHRATPGRELQRACCQTKGSVKKGERSSTVKNVTRESRPWLTRSSLEVDLSPSPKSVIQCPRSMLPLRSTANILKMDPSTWRKGKLCAWPPCTQPSESFMHGVISVFHTETGERVAQRTSLKASPDLIP